jgi:hypothetical protein
MEALMRLAAAAGHEVPQELQVDVLCSAGHLDPQQEAENAQKLETLLAAAETSGHPLNLSNNEGRASGSVINLCIYKT